MEPKTKKHKIFTATLLEEPIQMKNIFKLVVWGRGRSPPIQDDGGSQFIRGNVLGNLWMELRDSK